MSLTQSAAADSQSATWLLNGSPVAVLVPTGLKSCMPVASYANDAAAAVGGVPVGGLYHTTGTVKVRLA